MSPQFLQQLVQGVAVTAHGVLLQLTVADEYRGRTADHRPEPQVPQGDLAEQHGDGQQRQNGDDACKQRDAEVLHGDRGQVRDHHGQHQLAGFQFADLALTHQPQAHHDEKIEYDRACKGGHHRHIPPSGKYDPFPAVLFPDKTPNVGVFIIKSQNERRNYERKLITERHAPVM